MTPSEIRGGGARRAVPMSWPRLLRTFAVLIGLAAPAALSALATRAFEAAAAERPL